MLFNCSINLYYQEPVEHLIYPSLKAFVLSAIESQFSLSCCDKEKHNDKLEGLHSYRCVTVHRPDTWQEITLHISIDLRCNESKFTLFNSLKCQSANILIMFSVFLMKNTGNLDTPLLLLHCRQMDSTVFPLELYNGLKPFHKLCWLLTKIICQNLQIKWTVYQCPNQTLLVFLIHIILNILFFFPLVQNYSCWCRELHKE